MILTPDRETYAEQALVFAAAMLCRSQAISKEALEQTLSKLIASSYQEDEEIMESACMSIAAAHISEMIPAVRELVKQKIACDCHVENYEEYEEILHDQNPSIIRDFFTPRADPYPLYQELEYLDPECSL